MLNSDVSFLKPIIHFMLHSLILFLIRLNHLFFFLELTIKFLALFLEAFVNAGVSIFQSLNVVGMNFSNSFFHVIEF